MEERCGDEDEEERTEQEISDGKYLKRPIVNNFRCITYLKTKLSLCLPVAMSS